MSPRAGKSLPLLVAEVVANGNCSGCGACATLSPSITMELDDAGFLRPAVDGDAASADAAATFRAVCPGVRVTAPPVPDSGADDPVFGPYISVWAAWATDDEIRWRGSSGGVLTALSAWLLESGVAATAVEASGSTTAPRRTVSVRVTSRAEALEAAGSRYAPVGNVAFLDPADPPSIFVGKPCEADAAQRLLARSPGPAERPVVLSFFCAGVPSQQATDQLVDELGVDPGSSGSVHYRGRGWPGDFLVTDAEGRSARASYETAWGQRLGRRIQDRCKICPDGTGMHADIAVGDFWSTDESGYPRFEEGDGVSVAIARTARGEALLRQAEAAGVVAMRRIDIAEVAAVQPSQVRRRVELPGRLLGRRLAGRGIPQFRRFRLLGTGLRRPRLMVRTMRGTYRRTRGRPG